MSTLRRGDEGPLVTKLQEKLGVDPIGKFGPKTETALKEWQTANGLQADGIAGPFTLSKLGIEALPQAPVITLPNITSSTHTAVVPNPVAVPDNSGFKLDKLKGHIPDAVIAQIPDTAARFNITNALRLAHFLSQCGHESGSWKAVRENLNYSAKGLMGIFKKYFPTATLATAYERQPEKIANRVYASRMGNGNENSGDGYKFRGRGYIQLTGKENYTRFDATVPESIVSDPDLVATKYPLASAAFFFNSNKLWAICDQGATPAVVTAVTKRVNGGTIGLPDRIKHFNEYYKLLS
jgi:putative chitinase